MNRLQYLHWLAIAYCLFFAVLAINPVSRTVWIAEMIPVVLVFAGLVATHRYFRFSNTAYTLMAVWLFWHTIGGHYTFANVPFDWFSELVGSERNHFDRIGHFAVGFYAFAAVEWLTRRGHCRVGPASVFGLLLVMAIAAGYEIIGNMFYKALLAGLARHLAGDSWVEPASAASKEAETESGSPGSGIPSSNADSSTSPKR